MLSYILLHNALPFRDKFRIHTQSIKSCDHKIETIVCFNIVFRLYILSY